MLSAPPSALGAHAMAVWVLSHVSRACLPPRGRRAEIWTQTGSQGCLRCQGPGTRRAMRILPPSGHLAPCKARQGVQHSLPKLGSQPASDLSRPYASGPPPSAAVPPRPVRLDGPSRPSLGPPSAPHPSWSTQPFAGPLQLLPSTRTGNADGLSPSEPSPQPRPPHSAPPAQLPPAQSAPSPAFPRRPPSFVRGAEPVRGPQPGPN
mmetsp:Transcript_88221/g.196213  ORF Transcript_88221/g.196213 Transcript_88221/m.196213 type:complete len:206 (+) Transcript_88221:144-761(+)